MLRLVLSLTPHVAVCGDPYRGKWSLGFLLRALWPLRASPSFWASLYVDDLQISCEGSDMRMIERQLQTAVNNIVKWCDTNGHSISASKSCCVHFCRKRGIHPDPEIRIRDIQIPVVPDVRFLGVIFDRRLTFLPHILPPPGASPRLRVCGGRVSCVVGDGSKERSAESGPRGRGTWLRMARRRGLLHIEKSSLASALDRAWQHVMGVSPLSSFEESSSRYTGHVRKALALASLKQLAHFDIQVKQHATLNYSRGVISAADLYNVTEEKYYENMAEQNVSQVRRITIRRDGQVLKTKHLILTFATPDLPQSVKVAYLHCPVRPYIPNPLRCFQCQRFGHSKTTCRGQPTCACCAEVGHDSADCKAREKCVNCKGRPPFIL
ncbi:uncharacterized protein TNCV_4751791 [Trichonephila clavipes]|nr:uncharacterized protein TNCV_4751791 [Trichonephila clavipes]